MTLSRRAILKCFSLLPVSASTWLPAQASASSKTPADHTLIVGEYVLRNGVVRANRAQLARDCADGLGDSAFLQRHQRDFATSNTLIVQGWVLSRAEVSRCALAYMNTYL